MILSNLHTHTIFSDGDNSPQEVIERAIELNFESIGFSEHAECGYDIGCSELGRNDQIEYFKKLDLLQNKYPQIKIYKGLELDSLNWKHEGTLDYSIGSVHNLLIDNKVYTIDWKIEYLKELIEICNGEKNFIIKYYEEIINFAKNCNYDITGHLDLFTKFNEKEQLFNIKESWYLKTVKEVIKELNILNKIIEINTGAIARGYRTSPYPDIPTIEILKELNSKIIISSDSHSVKNLNTYFNEIEVIIKKIGINKIYKFSNSEFIPYSI